MNHGILRTRAVPNIWFLFVFGRTSLYVKYLYWYESLNTCISGKSQPAAATILLFYAENNWKWYGAHCYIIVTFLQMLGVYSIFVLSTGYSATGKSGMFVFGWTVKWIFGTAALRTEQLGMLIDRATCWRVYWMLELHTNYCEYRIEYPSPVNCLICTALLRLSPVSV